VMRAVVEGRSVIIVLLDAAREIHLRAADAQRVRPWLERQIPEPEPYSSATRELSRPPSTIRIRPSACAPSIGWGDVPFAPGWQGALGSVASAHRPLVRVPTC
jgi:D-alanyl-D-alanine carboxypeptidase